MQGSRRLNEYRTVRQEGEFAFTERKSRFIGRCYPVHTEAETDEILTCLRKKYWDATHNCYAFRLGSLGGVARSSDDGEPSGTAGMPILNVLMRGEITDALIVVTRYFGGVLLGAGGLVRAFGRAAASAVQSAGIIRMRECRELTCEIPYPHWGALERLLREAAVELTVDYGANVLMCAFVPAAEAEALSDRIVDRTEGRVHPALGGVKYLPVDETDAPGLLEEDSNENS